MHKTTIQIATVKDWLSFGCEWVDGGANRCRRRRPVAMADFPRGNDALPNLPTHTLTNWHMGQLACTKHKFYIIEIYIPPDMAPSSPVPVPMA